MRLTGDFSGQGPLSSFHGGLWLLCSLLLPQLCHLRPSLTLAWTLPLTQLAKATVWPLLLLGQHSELRLEPLCLR